MLWARIAFHLRTTVQELAARITYSEFLDMLEVLRLEDEKAAKMEFYLAQIAAEVRRTLVENPKSVKVQDMIVEIKRTEPVTDWKEQMAISKAAYAAMLGPTLKKVTRN